MKKPEYTNYLPILKMVANSSKVKTTKTSKVPTDKEITKAIKER